LCILAGGAAAIAAPALWVARDADTEVYLFGTMHVLTPDARWRTRAYDEAYAKADTIWFETDLDAADPPAIRELVARYGVDPERTLSQKLGPAELAALKPILARGRTPLAAIDHMRPWAAALMLSIQPMTDRGYRVESGADLTVTRQARAEVKQVRTFETLEDQVRMFAGLPEPVELQYLTDVIKERAGRGRRGEGRGLQAAWIDGDLARLGPGLVGAMKVDSPQFYEAFLRRRNLAWAETLAEVLDAPGGAHLVNVGALHMVGEDGLPTLLAARGYSVRRIQ
jgi:uncharacterized protein YbaP (TraB family)